MAGAVHFIVEVRVFEIRPVNAARAYSTAGVKQLGLAARVVGQGRVAFSVGTVAGLRDRQLTARTHETRLVIAT